MEVLVIGCGIIGLTTAITLLKTGKYRVTIIAKDLPPNTTSNKAAAVWYPFLAAPMDKIGGWASETMDYLKKEAENHDSGVILQKTVELHNGPTEDPAWKSHVPSFRAATQADLPAGFAHGHLVDGVVADTDRYLDYLMEIFRKLGGKIIQKEIKNLDEVFSTHSIVINCTGLGARELLNDTEIYPTRGQIVVVKNKAHAHSVMYDGANYSEIAYIVPRRSTTVLGGTAQVGDWSLEPSEKDTQDILRKTAKLYPEFSNVEIVQIKVGLRPTRKSIRLECERRNGKLLIHNYGHGGSGFTLGWGCATEVAKILGAEVGKSKL